jgi:hypothetical protein
VKIRPGFPGGTTVSEGREVQLICEITSTNKAADRVLKMHYYVEAGIPWYLLVEPDEPTLKLYRWESGAYVLDQVAKPGVPLLLTDPVEVAIDPGTLIE